MTIQEQIAAMAPTYGVPVPIALAVAQRESGFNQAARGAASEVGVYQLLPTTAAELGVNPYDLAQNIQGGLTYLRRQYDTFGDWSLALAAYNAGPGNVSRGVIPTSTQRYVSDILAASGYPGVPSYTPPVTPIHDAVPLTAGMVPDFSVTGYGTPDFSTTLLLLLLAAALVVTATSS